MKRIFAASFCLLALAACAPHTTQQQTQLLKLMADRPMTCSDGPDCNEKWNRALQWVNSNNTTGMRTVNADLIATNMFTGEGKDPPRFPEFAVVRTPGTAHNYTISFTSYCEHGFSCGANTLKYRAAFTNAVMGLPDTVIQTGPNAYRASAAALGAAQ